MNNILNSKQQTIFKMIKISWIMWKKALYQTIPFSLICLAVNTFLLDTFIHNQQNSSQEVSNYFVLSFPIIISKFVFEMVIFSITTASIIYILNKTARNESICFVEAIKVGFKKWFTVFIIYILEFAVLGIGIIIAYLSMGIFLKLVAPINNTLLLYLKIITPEPKTFMYYLITIEMLLWVMLTLIPSVIIEVYLTFSSYLPIIEENGIVRSIKNSFRVISGSWRYMFVVCLITFVIIFICSFLSNKCSLHNNVRINYFLTNFPITIFIIPFFHAFIITMLYNFKTKKQLLE